MTLHGSAELLQEEQRKCDSFCVNCIILYLFLMRYLTMSCVSFSPNGATPGRTGTDKTAYVRGFDKYQDEDSVGRTIKNWNTLMQSNNLFVAYRVLFWFLWMYLY